MLANHLSKFMLRSVRIPNKAIILSNQFFGSVDSNCKDPEPPKVDKCGRIIPKKNLPFTVTVVGANCSVGATLSALLKQNVNIGLLKIFDQQDVCGMAYDISHINTSVKVKSYTGYEGLPEAITDSNIVAICGGCQTDPCMKPQQIFEQNAGYVRNIATMCAEFNPDGFIVCVTEPVNFLVPLIHQEFLKAGTNNSRRLAGVVTTNTMAANTIVGTYAKVDKSKVACPIIGGNCPKTLVPLLSHAKVTLAGFNAQKVSEEICYYAYKVLQWKFRDCAGPCYTINAYAANKFMASLIRGMTGQRDECKEYAFIKQFGKLDHVVPYMTTLVEFDEDGIKCTSFPKLNDLEQHLLKESYLHLRNHINAGESFVNGRVFSNVVMKKSCRDRCKMTIKEEVGRIDEMANDSSENKEPKKIRVEIGDSIIGKDIDTLVIDKAYVEDRKSPCEKKCPSKV